MDLDPNGIPNGFWKIIDKAQRDKERLKTILREMDTDALHKFYETFLRAAAYINGDPFLDYLDAESEDVAWDVTRWVVSQGKEYYWDIWNHPDPFPPHHPDGNNLSTVALQVYKERFGYLPEW